MGAGRDESEVRRPQATAWSLLGAFWGYAVMVGVLAMAGGTLLAMAIGDGSPPVALRLAVIVVVAAAAGLWSPAVLRLLRRLPVRGR